MTSEPKTPGQYERIRAMAIAVAARKQWEAANSARVCECHTEGLADAWTQAKAEDAWREHQREMDEHRKRTEEDAPFRLQKHGVPKRAATALLALNDTLPGPRAVRGWLSAPADQRKPFLLLLGDTGTGKSVAAAYACLGVLASVRPNSWATAAMPRDPCMWVATSELANLSSFTETDRAWFERMQETPLLVLDDLGSEQLHAQALPRLERLIDQRYGNNLRTVITSNADAESFKVRAGARIADRIREAGRVVNCGNVSLRRAP